MVNPRYLTTYLPTLKTQNFSSVLFRKVDDKFSISTDISNFSTLHCQTFLLQNQLQMEKNRKKLKQSLPVTAFGLEGRETQGHPSLLQLCQWEDRSGVGIRGQASITHATQGGTGRGRCWKARMNIVAPSKIALLEINRKKIYFRKILILIVNI